ncbi:amidohydrolase family protein [Elioraea rosea]|uniref:amidohydrolase family protein n=1 Tax=Elioraea rosea TaxID=2492390 RepID=UPI001183580C|nr:amidohydrolase family protein [Elioraea rosea]
MTVDSHFHIWRRDDLPWLSGPMQPRIFGPYEPIRRDYPIEEYLLDLAGQGVTAAVYIQANWPTPRAEDEVAWVSAEADRTGWPQAIVGYADLTRRDAMAAVDRLLRFPRVRGIRQQLHWHENMLYRFAARDDLCLDPVLQQNIASLGRHSLVFELQVFAAQMAGAAMLADAAPQTTLVLQHAGMLEDPSDDGVALWRRGMAELARRPNVVAKLSGLGTFLRRLDAPHVAMITAETLRLFGPERCHFGSNFPIEKLWTDYAALLAAHREAVAPFGEAAARAVFNDTARRVYRL